MEQNGQSSIPISKFKIHGSENYVTGQRNNVEKVKSSTEVNRKTRSREDGDAPTEEHIILNITCPIAAEKLREHIEKEDVSDNVMLLFTGGNEKYH